MSHVSRKVVSDVVLRLMMFLHSSVTTFLKRKFWSTPQAVLAKSFHIFTCFFLYSTPLAVCP